MAEVVKFIPQLKPCSQCGQLLLTQYHYRLYWRNSPGKYWYKAECFECEKKRQIRPIMRWKVEHKWVPTEFVCNVCGSQIFWMLERDVRYDQRTQETFNATIWRQQWWNFRYRCYRCVKDQRQTIQRVDDNFLFLDGDEIGDMYDDFLRMRGE